MAGVERNTHPIPGHALRVGVPLHAPRPVGGELLPARVIERRIGPGEVVPKVELPWAVERDGAMSKALNH